MQNGRSAKELARLRTRMRSVALLLIAGALMLAAGGCDTVDIGDSEFTIKVDSISGPAAIGASETLRITFHGVIGPDGCWRLDDVVKARAPDLLVLTFLGRQARGDGCYQAVVILRHEELVAPPRTSPFRIRVNQPSGADLEKVVLNQ